MTFSQPVFAHPRETVHGVARVWLFGRRQLPRAVSSHAFGARRARSIRVVDSPGLGISEVIFRSAVGASARKAEPQEVRGSPSWSSPWLTVVDSAVGAAPALSSD